MINLTDVKKYYKGLPHQVEAVHYLGNLLLRTPAKKRLNLSNPESWLRCTNYDLNWLQRQISNDTLENFADIWRNKIDVKPTYFSQLDNPIKPYVTCNSSSHAMYTDYYLRKGGKEGLGSDNEFVKRVFDAKYGGKNFKNPSVVWDIQVNVCRSFGIDMRYYWDGNLKKLQQELKKGVSCINIYHKGNSKATRGGGHVILAIDYVPGRGYLVADPFGSRRGNYTDRNNGFYWISESEFSWAWQGCRTVFKGYLNYT